MSEKKLSPMMVKYLETKKDYPDCILFYRIGDFYEMFYEDAKIASEVLDLVLTGKDCGVEERAPMCGIPFHAADSYVTKLVSNGYKVAIAEQVEDPKLAKGLVKREVIRIVTPGTLTSDTALDERKNNFLMGIYCDESGFGISCLDVSTGEFLTTECEEEKVVEDELSRFQPSELVVNPQFMISGVDTEAIKNRYNLLITELPKEDFSDGKAEKLLEKHFHASLDGIGLRERPLAKLSAAATLQYVYDTQKGSVSHISNIRYYSVNQYMILDTATQRNLELTETLREKKKKGTLLWVLDRTKTAMGGRLLRRFIEQPLIDIKEINHRLDGVEALSEHFIDREELSEYLGSIYDFERLLGRFCYQSANPRDLLAFKQSLQYLPDIKNCLSAFDADMIKNIARDIDPMQDLYEMIEKALVEDPPVSSRDGGIIRRGFSEEVDHFMDAKTNGKQWLATLEQEEREKTGIKTLKIKYNRIFGYCFEVTNTFKELVPDYFIRKQTLAGGERYTTERLTELENEILGAEEKLKSIEYDLFQEMRDRISRDVQRIQKTSRAVAALDVLISLSKVATENNYVRPKMNDQGIIRIKDGRHPVIERLLDEGMFVSNDTLLDTENNAISIITGPNMAGKSTYMRQVALITLMAAIGSFVPAKEADISVCDRIFTRVGASDDLASGQSTFMVEMNEVANILRNASKRSLLILDEIGRGTSTFDGLSIAWAVLEYISRSIGAKTLFATHYHELTELEGKLPGVKNYCIAVTDHDHEIVFLRKIIRGGADQSYGIDVARLAGVPEAVIKRAKEIATELSDADILKTARKLEGTVGLAVSQELSMVAETSSGRNMKATEDKTEDSAGIRVRDQLEDMTLFEKASAYLRALDLNHMTPLDAMNRLFELKEIMKL